MQRALVHTLWQCCWMLCGDLTHSLPYFRLQVHIQTKKLSGKDTGASPSEPKKRTAQQMSSRKRPRQPAAKDNERKTKRKTTSPITQADSQLEEDQDDFEMTQRPVGQQSLQQITDEVTSFIR